MANTYSQAWRKEFTDPSVPSIRYKHVISTRYEDLASLREDLSEVQGKDYTEELANATNKGDG